MRQSYILGALLLLGLFWAMTVPLTKVAVSSGHHPLGLIFWQLVLCVMVTGAILLFQQRLPRFTMAFVLHGFVIALLGTVLPNSFSYLAVSHLPAGIMAILIATVPMFTLLIALSVRAESFSARRLVGVMLGAVSVVILTGPNASLPEPEKAIFVLVALIGPLCYGLEANYVAWRSVARISPIQVIYGASVVGTLITGPMAWFGGFWVDMPGPWQHPEQALVLASVIHALVYAGYIWLVSQASAVFASQIAYPVTLGGVVFSAAFLGERYSFWALSALGFMIVGLFLVQPRPHRTDWSRQSVQ